MVDLVKIRKKAKKEPETPARAAPESLPQSTSVAAAAPPQASVPVPGTPEAPVSDGPAPAVSAAAVSKLERFKQAAGQRRVQAGVESEVEVVARLELLTFVIAGEHYAVEIERIVEIVSPRAVTRIPNADVSVVGIMSLRGTIVTLVDVRRKLRHAASAAALGPDARIVVIDFHGEMIGFLVDRVLRVVKLAADTVGPHPVVHVSEQDDAVRGVFSTAGALTILLDLDKLLDSQNLAATST